MNDRLLILALSLFVTVACESIPADQDVPARITNANDASHAILQETVNEIIGIEVLLADSALTERSILVIENWSRQKIDVPATRGRIMEPPVRLQLVTSGGACILVDTRDGSRHELVNVSCAAE